MRRDLRGTQSDSQAEEARCCDWTQKQKQLTRDEDWRVGALVIGVGKGGNRRIVGINGAGGHARLDHARFEETPAGERSERRRDNT
jgi:hypothetical protein